MGQPLSWTLKPYTATYLQHMGNNWELMNRKSVVTGIQFSIAQHVALLC